MLYTTTPRLHHHVHRELGIEKSRKKCLQLGEFGSLAVLAELGAHLLGDVVLDGEAHVVYQQRAGSIPPCV